MYRSPDIVRVIHRWAVHAAKMEEGRSAFKILTGKPTGRWEDNIRMDIKEIGFNTRNWVNLAQDMDYWRALVNVALNLQFP